MVWANRLKKEKERHKNFELFDLEIITRREYYSSTINQRQGISIMFYFIATIRLDPQPMLHERNMYKENMSVAQSVLDELKESKIRHKKNVFIKYYEKFLQRIFINFRYQKITFGKHY